MGYNMTRTTCPECGAEAEYDCLSKRIFCQYCPTDLTKELAEQFGGIEIRTIEPEGTAFAFVALVDDGTVKICWREPMRFGVALGAEELFHTQVVGKEVTIHARKAK